MIVTTGALYFGASVIKQIMVSGVGRCLHADADAIDQAADAALVHVVALGQLCIVVAIECFVQLGIALAELPVVVLGEVDVLTAPHIGQVVGQ